MEYLEYHTPDGLVYRFDENVDQFMPTIEGEGMPQFNYLSTHGPFQHGNTNYGFRAQPRTIQLQHRVNACSRDEYFQKRGLLLNRLRPNRQAIGAFAPGHLLKRFPDGSLRQIDVFVQSGPVFAPRNLNAWEEWSFTETIQFIAPDPIYYDPNQVSVSLGMDSATDHLIFPFTFRNYDNNPDQMDMMFGLNVLNETVTTTYLGTWLSYPNIQITGPLNGMTLRNITTGEKIEMRYNISAGEVVTIGLQYGDKFVENNLGVNLIGTVTEDSHLASFHIEPEPGAPGGVNTFTLLGSDAVIGTTQIVICYYNRYIGY